MNRDFVKPETQPYEVSQHLRTSDEMRLYLNACIVESKGDPVFILKAIDDVALAHLSQWLDEHAARSPSR